MTLYDRLAAHPAGSRVLAQARIRREVLRCLHRAQAASGLSVADIAAATGDRRREIKRDLDGDGNIRPDALARYLHAMGYELELTLVPVGEPRRKVVEESAYARLQRDRNGKDLDFEQAMRGRKRGSSED